jgi:hypothetical protein
MSIDCYFVQVATFCLRISINPENVETIKKWPPPRTKKGVQYFLGTLTFTGIALVIWLKYHCLS